MKKAAGRKARYGGHTVGNDHRIYRMLSLCPPLIRGTIPPWVLLSPFCGHGAPVGLFLGLAHHCALLWWCMAATTNPAAWQKRKIVWNQRRASAMRSAVGPCWIHQAGRINHDHDHDHDIPRDDQHSVIDRIRAPMPVAPSQSPGTAERQKNAFSARSTDDRSGVTCYTG